MKSFINKSITLCVLIVGIISSGFSQTQKINTLQITGTTSGAASDSVLVVDPTTGIVKRRDINRFGIPAIDVTVDVTGIASGLSSPNSFTGATFSPNTPASSGVVYVNTADGTQWTYNGSQYVTYVAPAASSNYSLAGGTTDASNNKASTIYRSGAVGLGVSNTPDNSAQLDVNSTSKGFLPPRMTQAQRNAISAPSTGLIVYCTDCSPVGLKVYDGYAWANVGGPVSPTFSSVCNGFVTGTYLAGSPLSGATYTVSLTNTSTVSATIAMQTTDLTLSGVAGVTVASVSTPSLTLAAGASSTVTYTLSGSPTTSDSLVGTWSKMNQTCSKKKFVSGLAGLFSASYCDSTKFNGSYVSGVAFSGNTVTVKLTNTSGSTTPTLPAPTTANLALSYTGTGTLTVASVSPNTSYTIANGASQTITYTLSGTPTSTGTLTGVWTYGDMTCTKTKNVGLGDATFTTAQNNKYVFSVNDAGLPLNVQGTLAIGTTVSVPYTSGIGTYNSYTSPDIAIPSQFCEDGASNWTLGYSYAGGTFSTSGSITVTLITKKGGTITAWDAKRVASITTINFNCASVPWSVNGNSYSNTVGLDEGGDAIRGSLSTSGAAYDAASVNNSVPITQAEYNNMMTIVPGATKRGVPTVTTGGAHSSPSGFLGTTTSGVYNALGSNQYVAGVAICPPYNTGSSANTNFIIVVSNGNGTALTCLNTTSPSITGWTGSAYRYFAIKRPSVNTGTAKSYLGYIWNNASDGNTYENSTSSTGTTYYGLNATTCGTYGGTNHNYSPALQVIVSTQKSW